MTSRHIKILVVDDDSTILWMMKRILELEGYEVVTASNGENALQLMNKSPYSLVLLDIIMPEMDGLTVCKTIRQNSSTPIILVTARGNINEKLEGFEVGADDYVTKPFSPKELVARVNAVLRRTVLTENNNKPASFQYKDLEIDFEKKIAKINNRILDLTATEYKLLAFMANNPFKILTPDNILREVWGEKYVKDIHLLQVNIGRLRQKMKDINPKARIIETKQGQGYLFNPDSL
jgi:DNA-binding response OmpR family regulator